MNVRSVERTVDVLELLLPRGRALSLTDIALRLHTPKSTTLGILRTLVARGLVALDRDAKTSRLGLGMARFAVDGPATLDLGTLAKPHLEALAQCSGETAFLTVVQGDAVYYTAKVDSPAPVRYMAEVGARRPLHAIASGKLALAQMSDADVRAYIKRSGLARYTPTTIVRSADLFQELRKVRRLGYAVNVGGFIADLFGIAAPLRDTSGRMVAAINVGGPVFRLRRRAPELAAAVVAAGRALEAEMRLTGGHVQAGS